MMLHKPTLQIERMVVKRNENIAYDEKYHDGVNVIRGENSSGKSTIMNFLFYGLGGDLSDWSDYALKCTHVWLQVRLNGNTVTFRRDIVDTSLAPMEIFSGNYEDALEAPIESWRKHPYRRSQNMESFSQAIFRLLEMPDVALEGTGNLTVNQILRLLYADQLSPIDEIFKQESQDYPITREAIGHLLCGAFENSIYEMQQNLRKKEKEFQSASSELRSIITVLGGNDESAGIEWVQSKKKNLEQERLILVESISSAEAEYFTKKSEDKISLKAQTAAYSKTTKLSKKVGDQQSNIDQIKFDMADSEEFIRTVQNKITALKEAQEVSTVIQDINFSSCPSCYVELTDIQNTSACHLCKTPYDSERAKERIIGLMNDASIQLNQSRQLQEIRAKRLSENEVSLRKLKSNWRNAANELQSLQILPTSEARERIRKLNRKLGYLDRTLDEFDDKIKLARKIDELSAKKRELNDSIEGLKDRITRLKSSQLKQLQKARGEIELETIDLLKHDLRRQDSFENPDTVNFSFNKNDITVDGQTYFSASSRVILKSSFLLGFLAAALRDESFRHPRFLMIDITEDKGMEVQRSQNFQHQIMRISNNSKVQHQIIFATAMPSGEISEDLLVGKYSNRDDGTLEFLG